MDTNKIYAIITNGNTNNIDEIFSELKSEQQALLNYLDNENDTTIRNSFMSQYNKIQDLGEALYKYEQLIKNNLIDEANETANEIIRLLNSCIVFYKWKTEPHACERCQLLDGMTYYSAEDIPQRPHPNCKCKVVITKTDSNTPYEVSLALNRKIEPENTIQVNMITPDKSSNIMPVKTSETEINNEAEELSKQLTANLQQAQTQKQIIENIEQKVNSLTPEQQAKLAETTKELEKITKFLKKHRIIYYTLKNICNILISPDIITYLKLSKDLIIEALEEYMANSAPKPIADIAGNLFVAKYNLWESHSLYRVASPNYNYNPKYVQKNGKLHDSIELLGDKNLQNSIRERVMKEAKQLDCKVLELRDDSSLAQAILTDGEFTEFIKKNIDTLIKYKKAPDQTIEFSSSDLYNALHGAMVKNIRLNPNGTITLRIEDLYNFNAGRTSTRGQLGERLQNAGKLENYYIIIHVTVPAKF